MYDVSVSVVLAIDVEFSIQIAAAADELPCDERSVSDETSYN